MIVSTKYLVLELVEQPLLAMAIKTSESGMINLSLPLELMSWAVSLTKNNSEKGFVLEVEET